MASMSAHEPAGAATGFVPPPYPHDRLDRFQPIAMALPGGMVDLSIGTPCDPPPDAVIAALSSSGAERGYPPSITEGNPCLRACFHLHEHVAGNWAARNET